MNRSKRTSYLRELRQDLVREALSEGLTPEEAQAYATKEIAQVNWAPAFILRVLIAEGRAV